MLQALLFGKIDRWLPNKNPWQIEDVLTAVVFGSCEYAGRSGWTAGLYPFLAEAVNSRRQKFSDQLPLPADVCEVSYRFWPFFDKISELRHITIAAAEPELIISLTTKNQQKTLLF